MIVIIYQHPDHLELAIALANAIENKDPNNKQIIEVTNRLDPNKYVDDNLHIFVDLHHFANLMQNQLPPKYIMYNYQQLPFGRKHKFAMIEDKARKALAIWDYSELNRQLIKQEFGMSSILVPFGYSETFENSIRESLDQDVDVVFIGELSPRRKQILDYLEINLKLKVVAPIRIDGQAKMELIRRGKILLNMHKRDDDGILETARLAFYLANGAFIISERSSDQRLMNDFENRLIFADIADFPKLIEYYLKEQDKRQNIAQQAYQWITTEYQYSRLIPDISKYLV